MLCTMLVCLLALISKTIVAADDKLPATHGKLSFHVTREIAKFNFTTATSAPVPIPGSPQVSQGATRLRRSRSACEQDNEQFMLVKENSPETPPTAAMLVLQHSPNYVRGESRSTFSPLQYYQNYQSKSYSDSGTPPASDK